MLQNLTCFSVLPPSLPLQQPEDVIGPMREIADITARMDQGASVTEVNAAYEAHEFPQLERVESQMAMLKAVERVGKSAVVNQAR